MTTPRRRLTLRSLLIGAACSAAACPIVGAGDFTPGDLYMLTFAWPGPQSAVVHIDPVTGATEVLHVVPDSESFNAHLSFDPFRDRLVIMPDNNNDEIFIFIDPQGNTTTLPNPWSGPEDVSCWAPTGDGRIYMITHSVGGMGYIDANDVGHDLFDTDGVTPVRFIFTSTVWEDLIYDAGTNSLFLAHWGIETQVTRFALSADGTQLAAPPETVSFDAFGSSVDQPMGLSAGPNGTLFIKIDTQSNADGLRMFTVDPVTLAFAPYAFIGHTLVAGSTAGTYNSTHGVGIALDTGNDVLRSYVQSPSVQEGVVFATGVSSSPGIGEHARIITIGDTINGAATPMCSADTNGDGNVNVADLLGMLAAWGTADPTYDIAPPGGDGVVAVGDLLALLGNWGTCP